MPFAGYRDFADCVRRNSSKRDPKAYCATIQRKAEAREAEARDAVESRLEGKFAESQRPARR